MSWVATAIVSSAVIGTVAATSAASSQSSAIRDAAETQAEGTTESIAFQKETRDLTLAADAKRVEDTIAAEKERQAEAFRVFEQYFNETIRPFNEEAKSYLPTLQDAIFRFAEIRDNFLTKFEGKVSDFPKFDADVKTPPALQAKFDSDRERRIRERNAFAASIGGFGSPDRFAADARSEGEIGATENLLGFGAGVSEQNREAAFALNEINNSANLFNAAVGSAGSDVNNISNTIAILRGGTPSPTAAANANASNVPSIIGSSQGAPILQSSGNAITNLITQGADAQANAQFQLGQVPGVLATNINNQLQSVGGQFLNFQQNKSILDYFNNLNNPGTATGTGTGTFPTYNPTFFSPGTSFA